MFLRKLLISSLLCIVTASSASAQTLIGRHPGAHWLEISPDGRWLDAGSAHSEMGSGTETLVSTRRYDLRRGGFRDVGLVYATDWLPNRQHVNTVGTEQESLRVTSGLDYEEAPVVSLQWGNARRPTRVYRSPLFEREPYNSTRLSLDGRRLLVYSSRFVRTYDRHTARLLGRYALPAAFGKGKWGYGFTPSPDGRWILGSAPTKGDDGNGKPFLYDTRNKRLTRFSLDRNWPSSHDVWYNPTIFSLDRDGDSQKNHTIEFYDVRTLRRLWVMPDRYDLIAQPSAVILCGKAQWTWRDVRTGKVLRRARAPRAWNADYYVNRPIHGNFYFTLDAKGRIWRQRFQFLRRS